MKMRLLLLLAFVAVISLVSAIGKEENPNVENSRNLRKSVNFAYTAGNEFLNLIRGVRPSHVATAQVFKIISSREGIKLADLFPVYMPFIGSLCLVLAGILFIIFVPIVGFFFCCCRCAGKCGGKIKGMDPKHAICKRYTYALFLGIISIVQLGGIVLAFINNQVIHDTLTSPTSEISAVQQLVEGSNLLSASLNNITQAIRASESNDAGMRTSKISPDLLNATCSSYFGVLKTQTDKLNIDRDLGKILTELKSTVTYLDTVTGSNSELKKYTSKFETEIFNLKSVDIRAQVCDMISNSTKSDFNELSSLIESQSKVQSSTGTKLREIVEFFNSTISPHLRRVDGNFQKYVKVEYLEYRLYICIGVCCLLLLIVLFYFLGLCFGQCGERPFEDARICNRGVGANLMMAGVAFAFLFTPIIMVLEMGLFMSGGGVQTELCRYFYDNQSGGVGKLDMIMKTIPTIASNRYVNNSIVDSVMNRCPIDPMAVAFKLGQDTMTPEIDQKITGISDIVRNIGDPIKTYIVDGYFKSIEGSLLDISGYISNNAKGSGASERANDIVEKYIKSISSQISLFSLTTVKQKFKSEFKTAAIDGFKPSLRTEVLNKLNKDNLGSYDNVRCDGISRSARIVADSICVTFLWPFNGFWYGVGICLVFTIPAIIFAVKLAGLYRRTEKYSADYEEPDYHSYMGFYTNNADNIPMKRPKSAKSNQKNRNSNSNNKESLKQNNPQYLPVYPYDAYE